MICFGEDVCRKLDSALRRWRPTELAGVASSTINGSNIRRYHALLVAATKPPVATPHKNLEHVLHAKPRAESECP